MLFSEISNFIYISNLIEKVKVVEVYQTLLEYSGVRLRFYIHRNIIIAIIFYDYSSSNPVPNPML